MADPARLLRELPEEPPPPEIVLVAVRRFRYRALGTLAVTAALAVIAATMVPRALSALLRPDSVRESALHAKQEGIEYLVAVEARVEDARVLLVEVLLDEEERAYAHFFAWRPGGLSIDLAPTELRVADRVAAITGAEQSASCCDPSVAELWVEFDAQFPFQGGIAADVTVASIDEHGETILGVARLTEEGTR